MLVEGRRRRARTRTPVVSLAGMKASRSYLHVHRKLAAQFVVRWPPKVGDVEGVHVGLDTARCVRSREVWVGEKVFVVPRDVFLNWAKVEHTSSLFVVR